LAYHKERKEQRWIEVDGPVEMATAEVEEAIAAALNTSEDE
jgi:hypothetical protein